MEDIIDIDPGHPEGERVPDVAGAAETEAVVRGEGGHQGEGEKVGLPGAAEKIAVSESQDLKSPLSPQGRCEGG